METNYVILSRIFRLTNKAKIHLVQTIQSNTNKYVISRIQIQGQACISELYLAVHAYANYKWQNKLCLQKETIFPDKEMLRLTHLHMTHLLTRATTHTSTTYCFFDAVMINFRYFRAVGEDLTDVFQSKQQGILGQTENRSWFPSHPHSLFLSLGRDAEIKWAT